MLYYILLYYIMLYSAGPLVLVICSFKCLRSSYSDTTSQYCVLALTQLSFNYDYSHSPEKDMFILNYALMLIFYSKVRYIYLHQTIYVLVKLSFLRFFSLITEDCKNSENYFFSKYNLIWFEVFCVVQHWKNNDHLSKDLEAIFTHFELKFERIKTFRFSLVLTSNRYKSYIASR